MVERAGALHTRLHNVRQLDPGNVRQLAAGSSDTAGSQHLLNGAHQAVGVIEHNFVEFVALGVIDRPGLQRFQIQPDGGDRRFQLVGHGIDKGVMLRVAADLADEKRSIQHHAADDHDQQEGAQKQQDAGVPVGHHPADVEQQDNDDQTDAERDEKRYGFLASGDDHVLSLAWGYGL